MAWEVESQIIADLINHGIVGFMLLYYWIIRIAIKGYKIDRRYSICITGILIESITYNVRFMWVLLFIMFLWISILKNKNIWIADNINLNVYTSKK